MRATDKDVSNVLSRWNEAPERRRDGSGSGQCLKGKWLETRGMW